MANLSLTGRPDGVVARVERKRYAPHARLSRHMHPEATIVVVLAGGFTERLGRNQLDCSRGGVLMRGPDVPHANDCGPRGAECIAITVSRDRLASDPLVAKVFVEPTVHPRRLTTIAMRIDAELSRGDLAAPLAVEGLALELLAVAIRESEPTSRTIPKCVREARALFAAEFATTVRVADVAAAVGVHPVYLARAFRAHFGYSPSDFVRLRRLEVAARALTDTDRSLTEIALETGFASSSHFSASFRKHSGLSPSAYRASAAGRTPFES